MNHFLLQAEGGGSGAIMQILFMVGIMVVFYLFFIMPQMKRQKKERQFRENLKNGDNVITIGGEHGTIASIDDKTILLEVDKGVKIRYEKSAISRMVGDPAPTK